MFMVGELNENDIAEMIAAGLYDTTSEVKQDIVAFGLKEQEIYQKAGELLATRMSRGETYDIPDGVHDPRQVAINTRKN